ncbi:hypothetical protein TWF696_007503 [Orbilia brochopaga]|uniref:AA9 family lytic polysaccharide monooxygenase n=1 Tax=Orbilia brochopaga TaxID=3140254 RepID=A0AAV9UPT9_9PEZI
MEWHHTLDSEGTNDPADPVDPSHKGPIMAYLAAVPDAHQTSVTGLKWFKVYEDGYNPSTNTWAVDKLIANKGLVTFKLPDCIPSGNYFLRGELIALHGASSNLGAQFYIECAQINIVGGGTANPPTVSFPGAYGQSDPGILINMWQQPYNRTYDCENHTHYHNSHNNEGFYYRIHNETDNRCYNYQNDYDYDEGDDYWRIDWNSRRMGAMRWYWLDWADQLHQF